MTTGLRWIILREIAAIRATPICKRFMDTATMRKRGNRGTTSRPVCVTSISTLRSGVRGNDHAPFWISGKGSDPLTDCNKLSDRFNLEADRALSSDMVVEGGEARVEPSENALADVSLRCDRTTFALMMYKRLTLDPPGSPPRVAIEGDPSLVAVLDQWLKQP
jgi:hypothetical protein